MAKNITLLGADYPDVPAVQLPQTGGGTATFYDIDVIDNLNSDSTTDALSAKQGKVLNDGKVNKAGDTMTNNLTVQRSGSVTVGFTAANATNGLEAQLIIGSGRKNHGVYSNGYVDGNDEFHSNAKWMVYRDADNNVIVNGKATENVKKTGDTMTGDLTGTNFISSNYDLETLGSKANGIFRTFHINSSNRTASFTLEENHHALVGIASGFASFYRGGSTLYNTTLPSGFTAALSGSKVTITRNSDTAFVIDGIVI